MDNEIIILILLMIIAIQNVAHRIERKDLYNRIMSKNLTEYKNEPSRKGYISAHRRVLERWRGKGGDK